MSVQLQVVPNMGSLGWVQCYWCPYWVHKPHVIEGLDWRALCGWCLHCFFSTTATLMSLLPEGELPDYCKDGGVFDILWMNEYAWRLLHF